MRSNEQTYWKIHDFLKGRLDHAEMSSFQKEMQADSELLEEVEKHNLANRLIVNNRLRLAQEASLHAQKAYKNAIWHKKVAISAGIALVMLTGLCYWFSKGNKTVTIVPSTSVRQETKLNSAADPERQKEKEAVSNTTIAHSAEPANKHEPVSGEKASIKENKEELLILEGSLSQETEVRTEHLDKKVSDEKPVLPVLPKKEEVLLPHTACANTLLKANVSIGNACGGENNGSIVLSHIRGGKSPYKYEIRSDNGAIIAENTHLGRGKYTVAITDGQLCSTIIENVLVKEVICEEEEKVFNPFFGELFELPVSSKNGTFVVYEKNGKIYFQKETRANEKVEWDGVSEHGETETGHFIYEIMYQDGTRKHGTLTITR